jgi:hypothetical protein
MRITLNCEVCEKSIGYIDDVVVMTPTYIEIAPTGTLFVDGDINIGSKIFFNCVGCRDKVPKNTPQLAQGASLVMTGDFVEADLIEDDGYTSKW